jgi:transposase
VYRPRLRTVRAGSLDGVGRVVSCDEAGRGGVWIHRALTTMGITNRVVDASSMEVNRRARRTKTDRLDALKLVMMRVRVCSGEERVWQEAGAALPAEMQARVARGHYGSRCGAAPRKASSRLARS